MEVVSCKRLLNRKYKEVPFVNCWFASFGRPEERSRWLIYGESGNGKTEFVMQLAAEMCRLGYRVWYVSAEQSDRSSVKEPWKRNISTSRASLVKDASISEIEENILQKKGSKKVVIIDSIDYVQMTQDDYVRLDGYDAMLVFVSWAEGKKPLSTLGKKVKFMVDVKVRVDRFMAFPVSRYGGNKGYVIYSDEAKKHHNICNK